jgi:HSP20 family molecular chaperone IbpA
MQRYPKLRNRDHPSIFDALGTMYHPNSILNSFISDDKMKPKQPTLVDNFQNSDLTETENEYVCTMDIGNYDKKNINILFRGKDLIVSGKRELVKDKNNGRSNRTSSFTYKYHLNSDFDMKNTTAKLENGTLIVNVPKTTTPNFKIEVQ